MLGDDVIEAVYQRLCIRYQDAPAAAGS